MEADVVAFGSYLHRSLAAECFEKLDEHLNKLDGVQEQPQLIDPHAQGFIDPIVAHLRRHLTGAPLQQFCLDAYRILYHFCKLRGAKVIVKLLPNHVSLLEPVLITLQSQSSAASEGWHSRYVLLLWLSLISMAPFDLKTFDLATSIEAGHGVIDRILALSRSYLWASSREREAAGLLIARIITRKDVNASYMPSYLQSCLETWSRETCTVHFRIGFLVSLCEIFRIGNRDVLQLYVDAAMKTLRQLVDSAEFESDTLLRKLRMKLSQRLALTMLKPTKASWRYKNDPKSYGNQQHDAVDFDEPNEPSEDAEEVIGVLLEGIQDRDNVVRYSAAKGIGRVTSRLPQDFAQEIVNAVHGMMEAQTHPKADGLQLNESASDATWQGCCLTIAELCRHGALLPDALDQMMPIIFLAMQFDLRKGSHSIGTIVRDAACYVLWSVLRCYRSDILRPLAHRIATTLIVVALFDREISVRRAASAAYQEGVGRHAEGLFSDGIAVLTLADFHNVGQRQYAFLHVAPQVFCYQAYRQAIQQNLVQISLQHWDRDIRELAARTLAELYLLQPDLVAPIFPALENQKESLDVNVRHGALFAAGELCRVDPSMAATRLAQFGNGLPDYALDGVSGALIGSAFCHYVQHAVHAVSSAAMKQEYYQQTLKCLKFADERTRNDACLALTSLTRDSHFMIEFLLFAKRSIRQSNAFLARGVVHAIGLLAYAEHSSTACNFVQLLLTLFKKTGHSNKVDPEIRQLAIISLGQVGRIWIQSGQPTSVILQQIAECLQDYAVDARGDVGSWVRAGAIKAALQILPLVTREEHSEEILAVISGIVQQCLSKIDNVHTAAVQALQVLIPALPNSLQDIQPTINGAAHMLELGNSSSAIPPLFVGLLGHASLLRPIVRELCVLAASSGHPRAISAREALVTHLESCKAEHLRDVLDAVISTIDEYTEDERVLVPTLEILHLLLEYQVPERLTHYEFDPLFETVQRVCLRSRHVPKLAASMRIYRGLISLLPPKNSAKQRASKKLGLLLTHPIPRVRILSAEQLFMVLTECEVDCKQMPSTHAAIEALLRTEWTGDISLADTACQIVRNAAHDVACLPDLVEQSGTVTT